MISLARLHPILCGICALALAACSSDSGPVGPGSGAEPGFEPAAGTLSALVGDTLTFRALDGARQPVAADWYVDGTRRDRAPTFAYRVHGGAAGQVLGRLSTDGLLHQASWTVAGLLVDFAPDDPRPWLFTGQTLYFDIELSHRTEAELRFLVDGAPATTEARFGFRPDAPGIYEVRAEASVLGHEFDSGWTVTAVDLEVDPQPGQVEVLPYEHLTLSVARSDELPVDALFTIENHSSARGESIEYWPTYPSRRAARARIGTPAGIVNVDWELVDASTVPPVSDLEVEARTVEAVVELQWTVSGPTGDQEPPDSYLVVWSEGSFGVEERQRLESRILPHTPGRTLQTGVVDGLRALTRYYFRVFARDAEGRVGFGTQLASTTTPDAADPIRVSGVGRYLPAQVVRPVPAAGARVATGSSSQLLGPDGGFALDAVSNGAQYLTLGHDGSSTLRVGPLPRADVRYDLLLVPDTTVPVSRLGVTTDLPLRDYLRVMTNNDDSRDEDTVFHTWPEYPVKVWVWDYTGPNGEHPSFSAAFRRGIDLWNDGATGPDRLLEYVAVDDSLFDPGSGEGVRIRLYPTGSSNLAEVRFLRPVNGKVALDDPELLEVVLRRSLPTQYLVDRVVAHELGHVLGLVHSPSETDLMHGVKDDAGGVPRPHEVYTARFLRHVAPGTDARWYGGGDDAP